MKLVTCRHHLHLNLTRQGHIIPNKLEHAILACVCKFKWHHIIYGFGVEYCKGCYGDVLLVFCATQLDRV